MIDGAHTVLQNNMIGIESSSLRMDIFSSYKIAGRRIYLFCEITI